MTLQRRLCFSGSTPRLRQPQSVPIPHMWSERPLAFPNEGKPRRELLGLLRKLLKNKYKTKHLHALNKDIIVKDAVLTEISGRASKFEPGQTVHLRLCQRYHLPGKPPRKRSQQRTGPFKILDKVGPPAYSLKLPTNWKIHSVVSIAQLVPAVSGPGWFALSCCTNCLLVGVLACLWSAYLSAPA